jgi:hypothetical protein
MGVAPCGWRPAEAGRLARMVREKAAAGKFRAAGLTNDKPINNNGSDT